MNISFIQPSRNNLKYLKWSYDSIRKNQGNHNVEICVYDDASSDGTESWLKEQSKKDPKLKWYKNDTGERVGHTIGYDYLINEVATHELCIIYHADMYLCPGALDAIEKYMYTTREDVVPNGSLSSPRDIPVKISSPKDKTICSLTRIEPPLHPDGPEKVLLDCGVEPEEFDEQKVLDYVNLPEAKNPTEGIFAPWAFWKKDFQEIGGHDPLYRPQSKEDSDIFNRFQLNGVKFVQTWEGFVYHMTCRGSRRNTVDKAKNIYEDSPEWLAQNQRSTRNFIRKFGHFCKHDKYMKPIVPNKYSTGIVVKNCNPQLLEILEPWCDTIYIESVNQRNTYILKEQPNTDYTLNDKILPYDNEKNNGIIIEIDGNTFSQDDFQIIQQFSEILDEQGEVGEFMLGSMKIYVIDTTTYTKDLIKIETKYNQVQDVHLTHEND